MPYNYFQPTYLQYPQTYPQMNTFQNGNTQPITGAPAMQNIPQPQPQTAQPAMQIQNGGFISVRSIDEAFNYPVAPGNAVTFKDELAPYIYEKIQSFSQLERPVFKKYRLVEEAAEQSPQNAQSGGISSFTAQTIDLSGYVKASDFEAFASKYGNVPSVVDRLAQAVDKLQFDVDAMSEKSSKKMVQKARKDADEE